MAMFDSSAGKVLGGGAIYPAGSLDAVLESLCMGYRRTVASRYLGSTVDRLDELGKDSRRGGKSNWHFAAWSASMPSAECPVATETFETASQQTTDWLEYL